MLHGLSSSLIIRHTGVSRASCYARKVTRAPRPPVNLHQVYNRKKKVIRLHILCMTNWFCGECVCANCDAKSEQARGNARARQRESETKRPTYVTTANNANEGSRLTFFHVRSSPRRKKSSLTNGTRSPPLPPPVIVTYRLIIMYFF